MTTRKQCWYAFALTLHERNTTLEDAEKAFHAWRELIEEDERTLQQQRDEYDRTIDAPHAARHDAYQAYVDEQRPLRQAWLRAKAHERAGAVYAFARALQPPEALLTPLPHVHTLHTRTAASASKE